MALFDKKVALFDGGTGDQDQNDKRSMKDGWKDRFDRPQTPAVHTPPIVNPLDDYFENHSKYLSGLENNVQSTYDKMLKYYLNAPAAYKPSAWQGKADAAMEQYLNRGPFQFDVNGDAMYQQLKDQYIQQGHMAMMDTMGQAAAMTGGYGNSYAQSVGQQAYNQQLNQLNSMVPELYAMAQDRYDQEGQDMLARYSLYSDREAQEYEKYKGELANWMSHGQELTDAYTAAQKQYADATTYKEPSAEMISLIEKAFGRAESEDDIWSVLNKYQALGYDPAWLYALASERDFGLVRSGNSGQYAPWGR